VGLLWVCGLLNYADRQALSSVKEPVVREFNLNDEQWGAVGSAFMWTYALSAPFAGWVVDHASRRWLVVSGLFVWSLVCVATGHAWGFASLFILRALEGLGETFYFPASMSLVADYHGKNTRSRAMSLHQTSVYTGTALGGICAAWMAQRFGWRTGFWLLGTLGMFYAIWLATQLREPPRGAAEEPREVPEESATLRWSAGLRELLNEPAAIALLIAFGGANFVAAALLWWLPPYVKERYGFDLTGAAVIAALFWPAANFVGALVGGPLADAANVRKPGGRARVQTLGLLIGAPCILLAGSTDSVFWLIPALIGIGFGKGIYDANIFAAAFDVVPPAIRGTTAGLMNTVGWTLGSFAPWLMGMAKQRYGLGTAIATTSALYLGAAGLAWLAAVLTCRRASRKI
jgi:sugar phosphate permease